MKPRMHDPGCPGGCACMGFLDDRFSRGRCAGPRAIPDGGPQDRLPGNRRPEAAGFRRLDRGRQTRGKAKKCPHNLWPQKVARARVGTRPTFSITEPPDEVPETIGRFLPAS